MDHLWDGFRITDAGSLVLLIIIFFWGLRQLNNGKWHSDREVQQLLAVQEKRFQEAAKFADKLIAEAQRREVEYKEIAEKSVEAADIMRSQLTTVVGELQIVGKTMHAINPSIQTEDTEVGR